MLSPLSEAKIQRDPHQVHLFKATHICPSTGRYSQVCKGYVVDHIKPLCAGGVDKPSNMQYQEYKQSLIKDKQERALCRRMKK